MLALAIADRDGRLELMEVPEPEPLSDEALVDVHAFSLNRGELRAIAGGEPGFVPGWDVAGVVARAAADGSGPGEGARVAGLVEAGAWAERAAVPTWAMTELPEAVELEQAAVLPVAGLTAYQTLALGGPLPGARVLITGAAGGVGRLAVQLAAGAGAHVIAVVSSPGRAAGLPELGATEIVHELDPDGIPVDLILESVGGASLAAAIARVAPGGDVVCFGISSGEPTTFEARTLYALAAGARVHGYMVFEAARVNRTAARDLGRLAWLVAIGRLDPQVGIVATWDEAPALLHQLRERQVAGKAVLRVRRR
jgi:NADPH:quinone reductase